MTSLDIVSCSSLLSASRAESKARKKLMDALMSQSTTLSPSRSVDSQLHALSLTIGAQPRDWFVSRLLF